ncbi:hypothetical protein D1AOALGA4SA_129 [Olavius algarvensis Delta 1 endosymbiont]|nr:hypothetical protein D1AOALGA4SA_129 [Olavius algarvensis Delta 1 endosymbiont]
MVSSSSSKLLSRFQYRGRGRRRARFKIPFLGLMQMVHKSMASG